MSLSKHEGEWGKGRRIGTKKEGKLFKLKDNFSTRINSLKQGMNAFKLKIGRRILGTREVRSWISLPMGAEGTKKMQDGSKIEPDKT